MDTSRDFKKCEIFSNLSSEKKMEFGIVIKDNTIIAVPKDYSSIENSELSVEGGTFYGMDDGEFGGALIFSPKCNPLKKVVLIEENCCGLCTVENRIFAITSLVDFLNGGFEVYELVPTKNGYIANKVVNSKNRAESFLVAENTLYIATGKSLLAFKDNQLHTVLDNAWNNEPKSMIYHNNCLYIGMRFE